MENIGTSKFFNSTASDVRSYSAQDLADYLSTFYANGVIGSNSLKVTPGVAPNLGSVNISAGTANINGYMYNNDQGEVITLTAPSVLTRYKVVLRLDLNDNKRNITTQIVPQSAQINANQTDIELATFILPANDNHPRSMENKRVFSKGLFTEDLSETNLKLNNILFTANGAVDKVDAKITDCTNKINGYDVRVAAIEKKATDTINSILPTQLTEKIKELANKNQLELDAEFLNGYSANSFVKVGTITLKSLGGTKVIPGTADPLPTVGDDGDIYIMYGE